MALSAKGENMRKWYDPNKIFEASSEDKKTYLAVLGVGLIIGFIIGR